MVKEIIGLLRMELMLIKYMRLKLKVAKHVNAMADYAVTHSFQTQEARETLRKMYRICEKEVQDNGNR